MQRVDTGFGRGIIGIEPARAFLVAVAVDVHTVRGQIGAVEVKETSSLNAQTEARVRCASADMILRTVFIEITGDTAIEAAPALAREAQRAIEARVATRGGPDTAIALPGDFEALPASGTHRGALAGSTARENAMLDRLALETVAARLDANRTDVAIVARNAGPFSRAQTTEDAGHARGHRSTTGAPGATGSGSSAGATNSTTASRTTRACNAAHAASTGSTTCTAHSVDAACAAHASHASHAAEAAGTTRTSIRAKRRTGAAGIIAVEEPVRVVVRVIFAVARLGSFNAGFSRVTSTLAATAHADHRDPQTGGACRNAPHGL